MEARTRDVGRLEAALSGSEKAKLELEERLKVALQENAKVAQVRAAAAVAQRKLPFLTPVPATRVPA